MTVQQIKNHISKSNPNKVCYTITFKDFSRAMGFFDKEDVITNTTDIWKFHLNSDLVNKEYDKDVIEVDLENIEYLDVAYKVD